MADDYVSQVAALTGLRAYPKQGPFGKKSGAAMGAREAYLLAVGPSTAEGNRSAIGIFLRFKKIDQPEILKAALAQSPALAADGKRGRLAAVGSSFLRWEWAYSLSKPKAEEVAELVGDLVAAVKPLAPAFDGRCELCRTAQVSEIMLLNSVPGYYCESCQQKARIEQDAAARAYEELPSNFPNGLVLGALAAVLGGLAWGAVAYLARIIFLYGAVLIGYLVAWAVIKGMGKVNRAGQVLVVLLTVASVIFGDAVFYTLVVMKQMHFPFSLELFRTVLSQLGEIEKRGNGPMSVLFALVGAGYSLYRARKPKFPVVFERLGSPAS